MDLSTVAFNSLVAAQGRADTLRYFVCSNVRWIDKLIEMTTDPSKGVYVKLKGRQDLSNEKRTLFGHLRRGIVSG